LENLPEAMKTEESAGLKDRIDELLKENPLKIQVYLNLRLAETELLKDLTTTPIQTYEILFKILILSDKLSDKLRKTELPDELKDLKTLLKGFPARPDTKLMHEAIAKYAELNLKFENNDEDLTKDEIKQAEDEAKDRARGKKKMMEKKKAQNVRSGKVSAKPKEPDLLDLLDKSVENIESLALQAFGPRKAVQKHLDELKETAEKAKTESNENRKAIDPLVSALFALENEKSSIIKALNPFDPLELFKLNKKTQQGKLDLLKTLNSWTNNLGINTETV